ncbi:MAG: hypothetical protein RI907_3597 [Pseudomonadota bacterium]
MRKIPIIRALLGLTGLAAIGAGFWWSVDAMVQNQAVNEARTVADMAEGVGTWASQYGGVHVRTQGAHAKIPGTFLTRSIYARSTDDAQLLQGAKTDARESERQLLDNIETYHWKNPALIQRELADVLQAAGGRAQFKLTARTVLNHNNAPDAFEASAIQALQSAPAGERGKIDPAREHWKLEMGRLRYARAVTAQASCLRCHDKPENAPEFLKHNTQFTGGGGFGYQTGKTAGVISVSLPLPTASAILRDALPVRTLAIWGLALAALVALIVVGRRDDEDADA